MLFLLFFIGVYRGYGTTLAREIPFAFIQFPLWEYFKKHWQSSTGLLLTSPASALCGACAGGIAAAITTPLDVAKTRIMLAEGKSGQNLGFNFIIRNIYRTHGLKGYCQYEYE